MFQTVDYTLFTKIGSMKTTLMTDYLKHFQSGKTGKTGGFGPSGRVAESLSADSFNSIASSLVN